VTPWLDAGPASGRRRHWLPSDWPYLDPMDNASTTPTRGLPSCHAPMEELAQLAIPGQVPLQRCAVTRGCWTGRRPADRADRRTPTGPGQGGTVAQAVRRSGRNFSAASPRPNSAEGAGDRQVTKIPDSMPCNVRAAHAAIRGQTAHRVGRSWCAHPRCS
jgi:hypothetical protein